MKRQIVKTKDDSSTLFVPELDEHYHSIHGALQESQHVFLKAGLLHMMGKKNQISILETGFGTGLNALLTLHEADEHKIPITYFGLEKYPVTMEEWRQLNYAEKIGNRESGHLLNQLHEVPWEQWAAVTNYFQIFKRQTDFRDFTAKAAFDLIYFDAFAPSAQPGLWTIPVFESMFQSLRPGGVLVTYCVKGEVRRNMKVAGFEVEKIPGPPGKREMARALKI